MTGIIFDGKWYPETQKFKIELIKYKQKESKMIDGKEFNLCNNITKTVQTLINSLNDFKVIKSDYDALGGFSDGLIPPDGITLSEIIAAYVSLGAVDTFITANFHTTNFYKVINQTV